MLLHCMQAVLEILEFNTRELVQYTNQRENIYMYKICENSSSQSNKVHVWKHLILGKY